MADYYALVYTPLFHLPKSDQLANAFWTPARRKRLRADYFRQAQDGDVILTTAPASVLAPLCREWSWQVIGAKCDAMGIYRSNRSEEEKRQSLLECFPKKSIKLYWGARVADHTLALCAQERVYAKGKSCCTWEVFVEREGRRWGWLKHWVSPEFFRFWCVGWLNMAAAWLLEVSWGLLLPANLAFSVGYGMSLLVSFTLNSVITFQRKMTLTRLGKYVLGYIPNFLVQFVTVVLLHNLLHWPYLLTCFLAAVVGTPVTFLCLKCFTFRQEEGE